MWIRYQTDCLNNQDPENKFYLSGFSILNGWINFDYSVAIKLIY